MEYNTTREPLVIAEYGRNIQNLVTYVSSLPDREQRTKLVRNLVNVLMVLNPGLRDQQELRQKLYDHLHIMSNFTLDIDSPYPLPARPEETPRPEKIPYSQGSIKLRPYGKYVQRMIEKAVIWEEGPEKEELVKTIANNLKRMYLNWNRDSVDDQLIHDHLKLLSADNLRLREDDKLHSTVDILKSNTQTPAKPHKNDYHRKRFNNNKKGDNGRRKKFPKN